MLTGDGMGLAVAAMIKKAVEAEREAYGTSDIPRLDTQKGPAISRQPLPVTLLFV